MGSYSPRLPVVMLEAGSNQVLATSTTTYITWATEEHDTHGFHSGSSAEIVIPVSGMYLATLVTTWASDSGGSYRQCGFSVDPDGVSGFSSVGSDIASGGYTADFSNYVACKRLLPLSAGAKVKCFGIHNRGSNTSVLTNSHVALAWLSKLGD